MLKEMLKSISISKRILSLTMCLMLLSGVILFPMRPIFAYNATTVVTVDNSDSGFTYYPIASWTLVTDASSVNGSYRKKSTSTADNSVAAKWTPTISTAGYYKIYMMWPGSDSAPDSIPVEIKYQGGSKTDTVKRINQTNNGGKWVYLGTYYLSSGTGNYVKINSADTGYTTADAVKFELSAPLSSPPQGSEYTVGPVPSPDYATGSQVNLTMSTSSERMLRFSVNGSSFYVKGACGAEDLASVKSAGGNAVRTYNYKELEEKPEILQYARDNNMKVLVGLWLRQEVPDGFNYSSSYQSTIDAQYTELANAVDRLKGDPAILAWAVGNEVDDLNSPNLDRIYKAINDLAGYIHKTDPYHPTVSVHAGSHVDKIVSIKTKSPEIDIVAFNSYAHVGNVRSNVDAAQWIGPYMVTEYAVDQPMEMNDPGEVSAWPGETSQNQAKIEQNDAQKYDQYYNRYINDIFGNNDKCIGSFAFKTQDAFRVTHTWYNMLVKSDFNTAQFGQYKTTAIYDALYKAWKGSDPALMAPKINLMYLNGLQAKDSIILAPSTKYRSIVNVTNEAGEALYYVYELRKESGLSGGIQPVITSGITWTTDSDPRAIWLTVPAETGKYRLYCYVYDETGRVGMANIPFKVQ